MNASPLPAPRKGISLEEAVRLSRESWIEPLYVQQSFDDELGWGCAFEQDLPLPDLPDPAPLVGRLAVVILEAVFGLRSTSQLVRWTTPAVHTVLARRASLAGRRAQARHRPRIRIRRIIICEPAHAVAEASIVVDDGTRVRAMAMRLNARDGRWRIEALQIG